MITPELKITGRKWSKYYPRICFQGLRRTTKTPGQTVTVSVAIQTGHLLNKNLLPDGRAQPTRLYEAEFVAMYNVSVSGLLGLDKYPHQ
jgi:hypothetical protein